MDYEKLKEVIAKKIKENGREEITGPVLQMVLMAMVDSLGEVYPHTYTDEQKAQARANIDALSDHNGAITKEKLSAEVQSILDDVANKQNIIDESLATIAKTIVGAINEVYNGGLKDASIATSKIEDGAVTEPKLADGVVTEDKLASSSVTNAKIANTSVSEEKIADNSISTAKVKDGAITEPKLDTDLVNVITSAVQPAELASALASYVPKADILATTGSATDKVMSQKAVTDNLALKANSSDVYTKAQSDAITNPLADSLSRIFRDLGIYPELEPVPLNSEVTGKYINSEGKYVDASDWNIASIGAVSLGNTYLLNMVSSANMVLGVALFVSRVYKRDKEGKIIGTTLTPLFSAKNTSIPASGYVLFEAMDDYDDVLICYKPALATQMLVARWGFKASHATQLRNLRLIVDNKTDFEGIYELLTAGYALNLVGKGNGEPQAFMSRKTGGGNITDGSAVIKEVDGVQPIVWNQLVQKVRQIEATLNGLTFYPQENGEVLIMGVATENTYAAAYYYLGYKYTSVANHKAFIQIFGDATRTMKLYVTDDLQKETNFGIVQWGTVAADGVLFIPKGYDCGEGVRLRFIVNDLTQMFGEGNEPSTYEEYLDRISHYHIKDAYAYNAGEVVNYKGMGIKTTNIDGTKSYVRDWSEVMKKYFPDGMTNLNGVKDFFNEGKAVRKWGVKVFDGTENVGLFGWDKIGNTQGVLYTFGGIVNFRPEPNDIVNIKANFMQLVSYTDIQLIDDPYIISGYTNNGWDFIMRIPNSFTTENAWKQHLADLYAAGTPLVVYYELAEPVEDIFEKPLNLTYTVINGGTETSLATENSTQFEGSIAYNKDYVAVVDELQLQNRVTQIEFENWEN